MSHGNPRISIIHNNPVLEQEYECKYHHIEMWTGNNIAKALQEESDLFLIIPPNFDLLDKYVIHEFLSLHEANSGYRAFYSDFLVKTNDVNIHQFLPSLLHETMNESLNMECPIFINKINDDLTGELGYEGMYNWRILNIFVQHGLLIYHTPKAYFYKKWD